MLVYLGFSDSPAEILPFALLGQDDINVGL